MVRDLPRPQVRDAREDREVLIKSVVKVGRRLSRHSPDERRLGSEDDSKGAVGEVPPERRPNDKRLALSFVMHGLDPCIQGRRSIG